MNENKTAFRDADGNISSMRICMFIIVGSACSLAIGAGITSVIQGGDIGSNLSSLVVGMLAAGMVGKSAQSIAERLKPKGD